jgi:hypothetical protein
MARDTYAEQPRKQRTNWHETNLRLSQLLHQQRRGSTSVFDVCEDMHMIAAAAAPPANERTCSTALR